MTDDAFDRLRAKVSQRKGMSAEAERAAMLYARWKGLTDERHNADAKAELDAHLDTMQPEDWSGMETAASRLGDETFKGLLLYAVARTRDQNASSFQGTSADREDDNDRS